MKLKKRGQVTIFVSIGIVLLIAFGIILFIRNDISERSISLTLSKQQEFNKQFQMASFYLKTCVDLHVVETLDNMLFNNYVDVYIVSDSYVFDGKTFPLNNYFFGIIDYLEESIEISLQNSYCLNNIPAPLAFLFLNASNTRFELIAGDYLKGEVYLDAEVNYQGTSSKIKVLKENYGTVYAYDFDAVFRHISDSFSACFFGFCLPSIILSQPPNIDIETFRVSDSLFYINVGRQYAFVNDKPVRLRLRVNS